MVRLAKITKNRLGAPVWAHILYLGSLSFSFTAFANKFSMQDKTFVLFELYLLLPYGFTVKYCVMKSSSLACSFTPSLKVFAMKLSPRIHISS